MKKNQNYLKQNQEKPKRSTQERQKEIKTKKHWHGQTAHMKNMKKATKLYGRN